MQYRICDMIHMILHMIYNEIKEIYYDIIEIYDFIVAQGSSLPDGWVGGLAYPTGPNVKTNCPGDQCAAAATDPSRHPRH
jgi:hypothetical protein